VNIYVKLPFSLRVPKKLIGWVIMRAKKYFIDNFIFGTWRMQDRDLSEWSTNSGAFQQDNVPPYTTGVYNTLPGSRSVII
jgi:hypothetical protein